MLTRSVIYVSQLFFIATEKEKSLPLSSCIISQFYHWTESLNMPPTLKTVVQSFRVVIHVVMDSSVVVSQGFSRIDHGPAGRIIRSYIRKTRFIKRSSHRLISVMFRTPDSLADLCGEGSNSIIGPLPDILARCSPTLSGGVFSLTPMYCVKSRIVHESIPSTQCCAFHLPIFFSRGSTGHSPIGHLYLHSTTSTNPASVIIDLSKGVIAICLPNLSVDSTARTEQWWKTSLGPMELSSDSRTGLISACSM